MKKIRKYLKQLGWKREKEDDSERYSVFFFEHSEHGEYQLHLNKEEYLLTDDSDEIHQEDIKLTKSIIDTLHIDFINKGIKSRN